MFEPGQEVVCHFFGNGWELTVDESQKDQPGPAQHEHCIVERVEGDELFLKGYPQGSYPVSCFKSLGDYSTYMNKAILSKEPPVEPVIPKKVEEYGEFVKMPK